MNPRIHPMRTFGLVSIVVILLGISAGCRSVQHNMRQGTVETGPRFDEDGRFTDQPKATIPIWKSK